MLSPRTPNLEKGQGPQLGFGLRRLHYEEILRTQPNLPFLELITDNYLHEGGTDIETLEKIRESYPIYFHGVGLSLGSTDPLNDAYLKSLRDLANRFQPVLISDHLSWGSIGGRYFHDLLPLAFTKTNLKRLSERIMQVQEILARPLILENISSYIRFKDDEFTEWDFLREVILKTGCRLLLDVNNIFVNSVNFEFDPNVYLDAIPHNSVAQIHIAGAKKVDDFYLDDHGSQPSEAALEILRKTTIKFGEATPIILEWDTNIPDFSFLMDERKRILSWLVS